MKKILLSILGFFILTSLLAQSPNLFNYQAVVRNNSGELITDQLIGIQILILQGTTTGSSVYIETHEETSNTYGLVNLKIGTGSTTDDFSSINWANGPYFIQIKIDATGGDSYQLIGTSQLLSVPYALYAKEAGSSSLPQYTQSEINALTPYQGMLVFNTDYKILQFYDGTQWVGNQNSGCVPQPNSPDISAPYELNLTELSIELTGSEPNSGIQGFWKIENSTSGNVQILRTMKQY